MVKQLTVIAGRDKGRVFLLPDEGTVQVGRGTNTSTRLNDLRVSRNHCEIVVGPDRVLLTDSNSAVGTFVNEQRISSQHRLLPGDVIKIGDTQIRFQDEDVAELKTLASFAIEDMLAASRASVPQPAAEAKDPLVGLVGSTLDRYEVGPVFAQGQASVIFRARDPIENQAVALKVLRPEFARSDGEMQRFLRGIQPLLPLRHPHIAALYAAGKTGSFCWMAMEFVDGESLSQVIQRVGLAGMLDWQHALRVALHVGQALVFLHQHQVIHNNIIPENILINSSDKRTKLSALMRARTREGNPGEVLTRPGDFLRDIAYMPAERARENTQGDPRSDIYSLGATIYALLTGRPPFEGKSQVETIVQIMQADPVPPREFQLALPEAFEQLVLRMLAKDPRDRYQSAALVVAELERLARNPTGSVGNGQTARSAVAPPPDKGISLICACGQRLQVREAYAGTRMRCPSCGNFVVLPGEQAASESSRTALEPPSRLRVPAARPPERPTPGWLAQWMEANPTRAFVTVMAIVMALATVAGFFVGSHDTSAPQGGPKPTPPKRAPADTPLPPPPRNPPG